MTQRIRSTLTRHRHRVLLAALALTAAAALLLLRGTPTRAVDIPDTLVYRGLLTGPDGAAATDGTYGIRVAFFDAATEGTELCQWTQTTVNLRNGRFQLEVAGSEGSGTCDGVQEVLRSTTDIWVETAIQDSDGSFLALRPRLPVEATFRAQHAEYAEAADGALAQALTFPGMVAMFRSSCPDGWDPVPSLEGRIPRGAAAAGGRGGAAVTGLAGDHTHPLSGVGGHGHSTSAAGDHAHGLAGCESSGWNGGLNCNGWRSATIAGCERANGVNGVGGHGHGIGGAGDHGHSVSPGGAHTHDAMPAAVGVVFCRRR